MSLHSKRDVDNFVEDLMTALLSIPMPVGEYVVDIRLEKRFGPNRDVSVDVTTPATSIARRRRKTFEPIDGLELEGLSFMTKALPRQA
ncbi:MAG: hypothetical protein KDJ47_08515 [Hyphomicrobiaceae bacterium]|nr:hypothetical protein [Hyphomicrobiaceae bacterium]